MDKPKTQIKLGPAVGSYANIFKPRAADEKSEPKYSISLLFEKKTAEKQLAELRKVVEFVALQKFGPNWKKIPKFHTPIRDGDVDKPEAKEYAGRLFCNASSTRKPGVVDRHLTPVMSDEDAYSGCKFVAAVNVYAFEKAGNKGVALGLNNLLVFEKGDRIDGKKDASEDFAEYVPSEGASSAADESPLD
jgi:hypothetical protein